MTKRAGAGSAMHALLDLELGEESSSDSDFRIEDHDNGDDDDDCSDFSDDENGGGGGGQTQKTKKSGSDDDDGSDDGSDDDEDDEDEDGEEDEDEDKDSSHRLVASLFNGNAEANDSADDADDEFKTDPAKPAAPPKLTKLQLKQARAREALEKAHAKLLATPICCACLGDRSDDANEIVECDSCGISVHEGCYGISDSTSVASAISSCSTEPWFCEACRAGLTAEPECELCPNRGGIYKETDVGKWVHLVCALYVPGVAFGEVDLLAAVTLFEMPYSKWGAKACSLCEDGLYARTGVCIGCDAGMCKTYFHVTCAQAAGLLSEAHSEEVDHADPFYAHCRIHSDKAMIKRRKRNYNGLMLKAERRGQQGRQEKVEQVEKVGGEGGQQRIERKLSKHRQKWALLKQTKQEPWVPTQKMPRLLSTSASACRRLQLKADLMGIDTAAAEFQETQMAALADVRKKWHIPPAFSVEFIGYYLDRTARLKDMKAGLLAQQQLNQKLVDEQLALRTEFDLQTQQNRGHSDRTASLMAQIAALHASITTIVPAKQLPSLEAIGAKPAPAVNSPPSPKAQQAPARPAVAQSTTEVQIHSQPRASVAHNSASAPALAPPPQRPMSVPTAAALKMGVGFPLTNRPGNGTEDSSRRILSTQCQSNATNATTSAVAATSATVAAAATMHECGICAGRTDQHMLAKCDTCQLFYHLGCLNPPLQRHPKKSKLYGWQCSECVQSDDSDAPVRLATGPRKSRTKYGKDGTIVPVHVEEKATVVAVGGLGETPAASANVSAVSAVSVDTPAMARKTRGRPRKEDGKRASVGAAAATVNISGRTTPPPTPTAPVDETDKLAPVASASKIRKTGKRSSTALAAIAEPEPTIAPVAVVTPAATDTSLSAVGAITPANSQPAELTTDPSAKPKSSKKQKLEPNPIADLTPAVSVTIEPLVSTPAPETDTIHNSVAMTEQELLQLHKLNRKRRKELKHRQRTEAAAAANPDGTIEIGERSPNKEHKKKRKRAKHDAENPASTSMASTSAMASSDGVPRIKIRFKALSLPGEPATGESHCFYVAADEVRAAGPEDDANDETNDSPIPRSFGTPDIQQQQQPLQQPDVADVAVAIAEAVSEEKTVHDGVGDKKSANISVEPIATPAATPVATPAAAIVAASPTPAAPPSLPPTPKPLKPMPHRRLSVFNPRKFSAAVTKALKKNTGPKSVKAAKALVGQLMAGIASGSVAAAVASTKSNATAADTSKSDSNASASKQQCKCDVCNQMGAVSEIVRCDECKKNYHFRCLDPPVKKTPKRRGYSWHCADCDPTDEENS